MEVDGSWFMVVESVHGCQMLQPMEVNVTSNSQQPGLDQQVNTISQQISDSLNAAQFQSDMKSQFINHSVSNLESQIQPDMTVDIQAQGDQHLVSIVTPTNKFATPHPAPLFSILYSASNSIRFDHTSPLPAVQNRKINQLQLLLHCLQEP